MPAADWIVSPVVVVLGAIQFGGLAAAAGARLSQGTRYEMACQWGCLAALAVVGGLCGYCIQFGPHAAATSAVTLLTMTMIAVVDLRQAC